MFFPGLLWSPDNSCLQCLRPLLPCPGSSPLSWQRGQRTGCLDQRRNLRVVGCPLLPGPERSMGETQVPPCTAATRGEPAPSLSCEHRAWRTCRPLSLRDPSRRRDPLPRQRHPVQERCCPRVLPPAVRGRVPIPGSARRVCSAGQSRPGFARHWDACISPGIHDLLGVTGRTAIPRLGAAAESSQGRALRRAYDLDFKGVLKNKG